MRMRLILILLLARYGKALAARSRATRDDHGPRTTTRTRLSRTHEGLMNFKRTGRNYTKPRKKTYAWHIAAPLGVFTLVLLAYQTGAFSREAIAPEATQPAGSHASDFGDLRRQAAQFIAYDDLIVLNPEQKMVMDEALKPIPAPCCSDHSIATCCCPCNLAKSTWGLSKSLIKNQHADVAQVRAAVLAWLQSTNPAGYTGDACFKQGCNRSFENNGCGGMNKAHVQ